MTIVGRAAAVKLRFSAGLPEYRLANSDPERRDAPLSKLTGGVAAATLVLAIGCGDVRLQPTPSANPGDRIFCAADTELESSASIAERDPRVPSRAPSIDQSARRKKLDKRYSEMQKSETF